MPEKFGVDELKPFAGALGQAGAAGYSLVVEKSGILPFLFAVNAPVNEFRHFFTKEVLAKAADEAKDLSMEEMKQLDDAMLAPMPAALKTLLAPVEGLFMKALAFVQKNLEFGKQDFSEVQSIVADFKSVFGIA